MEQLEKQQATITLAEEQHREALVRMEKRLFDDKLKLQKESSQKIAELSKRAHEEAILNLNETTRAVFRENHRVLASMNSYTKELDELRRRNAELEAENFKMKQDTHVHDAIIKEKIVQTKRRAVQVQPIVPCNY
jgi:hypothetical protein